MPTKIFSSLNYTFNGCKIQDILKAYMLKIKSRKVTEKQSGVTVLSSKRINDKYIKHTIQRKLPEFLIRFFNLNHVEYEEHVKLTDETIEIESEQVVSGVTIKFNMIYMFDKDQNSTVVTGILKVDKVPGILKRPIEQYILKQFKNEREVESSFLDKKM